MKEKDKEIIDKFADIVGNLAFNKKVKISKIELCFEKAVKKVVDEINEIYDNLDE